MLDLCIRCESRPASRRCDWLHCEACWEAHCDEVHGVAPLTPSEREKAARKQARWQQWLRVQAARERRAYRESAALGARIERDRD
jgi:hypothetical protein